MNNRSLSLITCCVVLVGLGLTGCNMKAVTDVPSLAPPAVEEVAIIDTSGSIDGTDLFAVAQNKIADRVKTMPIGGKLTVGAMNSDVTAVCTDVVVILPPQSNPQLERRARETNERAVAAKVAELIECSKSHGTSTELFGGISEAIRTHPGAAHIWVFSDLCETATIGNICDPGRLANPEALTAQIPESLTPRVSSATAITYIGAGRGAKLDAASVENLRRVIAGWTDRTGATHEFEAVGA